MLGVAIVASDMSSLVITLAAEWKAKGCAQAPNPVHPASPRAFSRDLPLCKPLGEDSAQLRRASSVSSCLPLYLRLCFFWYFKSCAFFNIESFFRGGTLLEALNRNFQHPRPFVLHGFHTTTFLAQDTSDSLLFSRDL